MLQSLSPGESAAARIEILKLLAKLDHPEGTIAHNELVLGYSVPEHMRSAIYTIYEARANKEDTLIIEPRGSTKTTHCDTGYLSHRIALEPDIRAGLMSNNDTMAANFSRAIMSLVEANEIYRELYGDLVYGRKWTQTEWIRRGSPWTQGSKDLTLFASGTGGGIVSKRFSLLLMDDILDKENTSTIDQLDKVRDWYDQTLDPCVLPDGVRICIGTRWAIEDTYKLLGTPASEGGYGYKVVTQKALIDDPGDDIYDETLPSILNKGEMGRFLRKDGYRSYWEEFWPLEELLRRRARRPDIFDLVMQGDVEGIMQGEFFLKRDYQWYGTRTGDPFEELPEGSRSIKMGVDFASSLKQRADFTARVTTATYHDTGDFYVMRAHRAKIAVGHDLFIVDGYREFPQISLVICEKNQHQSTTVQEVMRDYPRIPIEGRHTDTDKRVRARAVSEKVKSHKVYLHRSLEDSDYLREHTGFDGLKGHDDFVDAGGLSMDMGGEEFFYGSLGPKEARRQILKQLQANSLKDVREQLRAG
jgi:predicted phage terminase large subunit-like protein